MRLDDRLRVDARARRCSPTSSSCWGRDACRDRARTSRPRGRRSGVTVRSWAGGPSSCVVFAVRRRARRRGLGVAVDAARRRGRPARRAADPRDRLAAEFSGTGLVRRRGLRRAAWSPRACSRSLFDRRELVDAGGGGRRLGAGGLASCSASGPPSGPPTRRLSRRGPRTAPRSRGPRRARVSPWLAFPVGALIGLVVVFFGVGRLQPESDGLGNPHGVGSARAERMGRRRTSDRLSAHPSHNQGVPDREQHRPARRTGRARVPRAGERFAGRAVRAVRRRSSFGLDRGWHRRRLALVGVAACGAWSLVRPRGPAGRGAARLDAGLRQHRPRPQRRARRSRPSRC